MHRCFFWLKMFIFCTKGWIFGELCLFGYFKERLGWVQYGERRRARDFVRAIGAQSKRMETSLSHGLLQGREESESWLLNYSNVIRTDAFFLAYQIISGIFKGHFRILISEDVAFILPRCFK